MIEDYVDFIVGIFHEKITKNIRNDFRVLIDTANGATYKVAEKIYKRLGINFDIINNNPNGININDGCGSTHLDMLLKDIILDAEKLSRMCLSINTSSSVMEVRFIYLLYSTTIR